MSWDGRAGRRARGRRLEGAGDTWLGKGASYASGVLSAVVPEPIAGFSPALWVTDSLGKGMSEESYYQGRYDADVAMIEIGEAADAAAEVVGKILDGIEIAAGAATLAGLLNALNGTGGPALGAQAAGGVATVGGTAVGGGTIIGAAAIGGAVLLVVAGAYGGAKYAQGRGEANIDEDREKLEEAKEKAKGEAVEGDSDSKKNKIPDNDSTTGHIFRDAEGHIPDTPENRALLEDVANDPANFRGTDKYGNEWYTKIQSDGSQVWVESRNGNIFEGGVYNTPKPWNLETGLKKP